MQRRVFALDFDGLICDGFKECALVTWNGYHHQEISAFGERGLELIPGEFLQRFREYRNFATHLGHFLVSLSWSQKPIQTQQEFNAAYAALQRSDVEQFVRDVTAYRDRARTERRREWLGYHALYPGVDRLLRESPVPLYVVTAKDGPSVLEILRSHGIPFSSSAVYGEQTEKLTALRQIAEIEQVEAAQLTFFDDNLLNALQAREAGYRAYWALWGYHVPEHLELARKAGIVGLSLSDFTAIMQGIAAHAGV